MQKTDEIKPGNTIGRYLLEGVETLDPEGVGQDIATLLNAGWKVSKNEPCVIAFDRKDAGIVLCAAPASDNFHRLEWGISINVKGGQTIGYASGIWRPGDVTLVAVSILIKQALDNSQQEINKWTDALSEVRAAIDSI